LSAHHVCAGEDVKRIVDDKADSKLLKQNHTLNLTLPVSSGVEIVSFLSVSFSFVEMQLHHLQKVQKMRVRNVNIFVIEI
jgi:hypothetical protein